MSYETEKARPGRHHIWFVELDVDFCQLRYGEGACPAVLGVDSEHKCYNTEATCAVPEAYDPALKTYRFTEALENAPLGAIPSLEAVSLTPGKINVGGGLGSRSVVDLEFIDHPGSDLTTDPYLDEAGLDQSVTTVANLGSAAGADGTLPGSASWVIGPYQPAAIEFAGDPVSVDMDIQTNARFTLECWANLPAGEPGALMASDDESFALRITPDDLVALDYIGVFQGTINVEEYTGDGETAFFAFPYDDPSVIVTLAGEFELAPSFYTYEQGVGIAIDEFILSILDGQPIRIETDPGEGSPQSINLADGVPRDQWFHLAVRCDDGEFSTFINGELWTAGQDSDASLILDFANDLYYADQGDMPAPHEWSVTRIGDITGSISDARCWSVARPDLQIKLRYRDILTGSEPNLVAFRPLSDGWVQARDYNPLDVGTFWGKFRARNPYYHSRPLRVWSGYLADPDDLSTFDYDNAQRRDYLLDKISGPDANGRVRITAKDPLKLADNDRAQAPMPSNGQLEEDIDESASSVTITVPSGISIDDEYPVSGYARIGREVVRFNRSGSTFNLFERGARNTEISSHEADDVFQLCLEIDAETVDSIERMLLVDYADVPPEFIPDAEWEEEVLQHLPYAYSTLITEPVGVKDLLEELGQQAPHQLFWDERVNLIRFQAVKSPSSSAPVLTDDAHFIEGSIAPSDDPKRRVSVVVVNFSQIDPTEKLDEPRNFRASYVRADLERERQYGGRKIETINSRWVGSGNRAPATAMASLIGRRFGATPRVFRFSLDAKDSSLWTGDSFFAETRLIQSDNGLPARTPFQVLSVKEGGNGTYQYDALEYRFDPPLPEDPVDNEYRIELPNSENNINLYQRYRQEYPESPAVPDKPVRFVVLDNVTIGSTTTTQWAVHTGYWPFGSDAVYLELRSSTSRIVGRGGEAGPGLSYAQGAALPPAQDGYSGGPALFAASPITITNNGVIGGGGGGGGGAGGRTATLVFEPCGGGGGAGWIPGEGGYAEGTGGVPERPGSDGTIEDGGAGGQSSGSWSGGNGGDLGQPGQAASGESRQGLYYGQGGAAGNAIDGAANITFDVEGDIRGPRAN